MASTGVFEKIDALLPRIRERREEIEEGRKLPRDLVSDLASAGVFALGIPAALGGHEGTLTDMLQVVENISAVDGSTGWCTMIGALGATFGGMMTEQGFKEVFADPTWPTAGAIPPMQGTASKVEGGYKVTGKWRFASGITHADWVAAGCVVLYDGTPRMTDLGIPEVTWTWMPVTEIDIHDTWYVNGLRGTGSNDFSATDVFVPEHRTMSLFDPTNHRQETIIRMPSVGTFAVMLATVGLGIARGAIDELVELAGGKMPTMSMTSLASKPATQIEVAQLEAQLSAARSFCYSIAEEVWAAVDRGDAFTPRQNALMRLAAVEGARVGAAVTHRVSTIAGGSSLYTSSPIQRMQRDADAVTHHFGVSPPVLQDAGRVLLGLDPESPIF